MRDNNSEVEISTEKIVKLVAGFFNMFFLIFSLIVHYKTGWKNARSPNNLIIGIIYLTCLLINIILFLQIYFASDDKIPCTLMAVILVFLDLSISGLILLFSVNVTMTICGCLTNQVKGFKKFKVIVIGLCLALLLFSGLALVWEPFGYDKSNLICWITDNSTLITFYVIVCICLLASLVLSAISFIAAFCCSTIDVKAHGDDVIVLILFSTIMTICWLPLTVFRFMHEVNHKKEDDQDIMCLVALAIFMSQGTFCFFLGLCKKKVKKITLKLICCKVIDDQSDQEDCLLKTQPHNTVIEDEINKSFDEPNIIRKSSLKTQDMTNRLTNVDDEY